MKANTIDKRKTIGRSRKEIKVETIKEGTNWMKKQLRQKNNNNWKQIQLIKVKQLEEVEK